MARKKRAETKRPIESYEHRDKQRVNNPPDSEKVPEVVSNAARYASSRSICWTKVRKSSSWSGMIDLTMCSHSGRRLGAD